MIAQSPAHAIELIDKAFEEADIDTLVGLYDEAAVLIPAATATGVEIRGHEQLRQFYSKLLVPGRFTVRQIKTHIVEADGIALITSRWSLGTQDAEPRILVATVVFRRNADGDWKDLIDSGPAVLEEVTPDTDQ